MRLVTFGADRQVGLLNGERVMPLAEFLPDLGGKSIRELLLDGSFGEIADRVAVMGEGGGMPVSGVHLGPPITDPGKIICVGLNYKGHAEEQNVPFPEAPLLFCKSSTALSGPRDSIVLPAGGEDHVDYEVELAVVIGRRVRNVPVDQALSAVAGYMVGNDVSQRKWQKNDGQWFRAKSSDTFFPCGPALVTPDEVGDYRQLRLTTSIGNDELQNDLAGNLIHPLPELIAYISQTMTLEPGDIISTGTPAGVGCYRSPRRFLKAGDVVACGITGLGTLHNPVKGPEVA